MSSLLFPAYKLNRKNTQPKNTCGIVFGKAKGHGRTVSRTSVYNEAAVLRVPLKRFYGKFLRIHKETSVPESLFWCFLVNFSNLYKNTIFAEQHRTTASDYSSINSIEGSIDKRNWKLQKHCLKIVQIGSFFCSVVFCIRTEFADWQSKSSYSVRMHENTDQKKPSIWTLFTQGS